MEDQTAVFLRNRDMLFAVAYNMLGSVTDSEDVLQEVWLAWSRANREHVTNARAYLVAHHHAPGAAPVARPGCTQGVLRGPLAARATGYPGCASHSG